MNNELWFAAGLFALASLITPGPNNTMVLSSGVNFGLRRTLPHLLGIAIGFALMQLLVGLGLHKVFNKYPLLLEYMRLAGGAYLLWLGWKLFTTRTPPGALTSAGKPMGFLGAAAFQWVNPKAWVMCMTAMTAYLPVDATPQQVLTLSGLFLLLGLPCVGCWAAFGSSMRRFLQNPGILRLFNATMALALVVSVLPLIKM